MPADRRSGAIDLILALVAVVNVVGALLELVLILGGKGSLSDMSDHVLIVALALWVLVVRREP